MHQNLFDPATVRGQFEILFRPHKLRFKAPRTSYRYRLELDRLDRYLGRPALLTDLTDLTVGDAAEWVLNRENGLGLSVESTRGFLGRIRKVWDFLARKRIVSEFPTIENLRKQKRIPVAWMRDEIQLLWECLKRQPGEIGDLSAADWYCSLHVVMWRTSERIGALLSVRWENVDLRAGFLTIPGEQRKGGRQGRVYRLTPDCREWLARIREPQRETVWPWPWSYHSLWPRYKQILKNAGLPFGRERMFHCIRKSHASHLEAAGGDATASLGHASRETTQDYFDERIVRRDWPGERLFPLDGDGASSTVPF